MYSIGKERNKENKMSGNTYSNNNNDNNNVNHSRNRNNNHNNQHPCRRRHRRRLSTSSSSSSSSVQQQMTLLRNRFVSIQYDIQQFCQPTILYILMNLPTACEWIMNETVPTLAVTTTTTSAAAAVEEEGLVVEEEGGVHHHNINKDSTTNTTTSTTTNAANRYDNRRPMITIIANERCGTWYAYPFQCQQQQQNQQQQQQQQWTTNHHTTGTSISNDHPTCCFKSTDGHIHTWNFSLKRLNLNIIRILATTGSLSSSSSSSSLQHQGRTGTIAITGHSNNSTGSHDGDTTGTTTSSTTGSATGSSIIIMDASTSKCMPDSFSRTIPIWAAVLNRIAIRYRQEYHLPPCPHDNHQSSKFLYTPDMVVKPDEYEMMQQCIDRHVETLYESQAIVDPIWLASTLQKPLRPFWILPTPSSTTTTSTTTTRPFQEIDNDMFSDQYYSIICMSCSDYTKRHQCIQTSLTTVETNNNIDNSNDIEKHDDKTDGILSFTYIPGAADDHESWAPKSSTIVQQGRSYRQTLTPQLFWDHRHILWSMMIDATNTTTFDTTKIMDTIVQQQTIGASTTFCIDQVPDDSSIQLFDEIGESTTTTTTNNNNNNNNNNSLHIYIGSRRAGRPPHCWYHFDAILNVTDDMEYSNMLALLHENTDDTNSNNEHQELGGQQLIQDRKNRYYLQLPVREGKRDRTGLEHYMTLGILFILVHAKQDRKILVHCAQGMDRSVAIVIAAVSIFCNNKYPLQWNDTFHNCSIHGLVNTTNLAEGHNSNATGLSDEVLQSMLGREGRDMLFDIVWPTKSWEEKGSMITKETLRITLQLVKQYREKANPSRATMQKLHRFFCSSICSSGDSNNIE